MRKFRLFGGLLEIRVARPATPSQPAFDRSDFDEQAYLSFNPDVANSGIDPWRHFVKYGQKEGRQFQSRVENANLSSLVMSSGYFDPDWYARQHVGPRYEDALLLQHFLQIGVWEGRDPGPNFSTSWYLGQYPDIEGINPLLHYIQHGQFEGRLPCPPKGAIATLEKALAGMSDLDSDLNSNPLFKTLNRIPFVDENSNYKLFKNIITRLLEQIDNSTTKLIFTPWLIHSGSDVVVSNILHASIEIDTEISTAVVIVDFDRVDGINWLPDGQKIVNFAAETDGLSDVDKRILLEKFIIAVSPDACLNVNSRIMWDIIKHRGDVISNYTRIYSCLFCHDFDKTGNISGYAHTHFRDSFKNLSGIICDNATFLQQLQNQYGITADDFCKFLVLYQPPRQKRNKDRYQIREIGNTSKNILWAGRISKQKNYLLLAKIIKKSKKYYTFHIYGYGDDDCLSEFKDLISGSDNVVIHGAYDGFESIPIEHFDAYIYTSLWDGIPNTIIEVGEYGIPIIAPDVGGIKEIITEDRGWLIHDRSDPYSFIIALESAFSDEAETLRRSTNLKNYLEQSHSWDNFIKTITKPGQFLGGNGE